MDRLVYAKESGGLVLPEGRIALFGALIEEGLGGLDSSQVEVIQGFRPEFDAWTKRGVVTRESAQGPYDVAIVTLPRARDLAEHRIAQAVQAAPEGLIIVIGAKTDGVDSIHKALKKRVVLEGQVPKAHGRCIWFKSDSALIDWLRPDMSENPEGDFTAPGVFSADKADPGSKLLAEALPKLKGRVADLGAGWGWLSREVLKNEAVKSVHLVEADLSALTCARKNVTDDRAEFHWADATTWLSPALMDVVVMNPPFHTGRKGDPKLGQAFIAAAARSLNPSGQLFLVANRHLPYETVLGELFRDVKEIGGTGAFKLLHATRPTRTKR